MSDFFGVPFGPVGLRQHVINDVQAAGFQQRQCLVKQAVDRPEPEPSSRNRAAGLDAARVRSSEQVSGSDVMAKPQARESAQMPEMAAGWFRLEKSFKSLIRDGHDAGKERALHGLTASCLGVRRGLRGRCPPYEAPGSYKVRPFKPSSVPSPPGTWLRFWQSPRLADAARAGSCPRACR